MMIVLNIFFVHIFWFPRNLKINSFFWGRVYIDMILWYCDLLVFFLFSLEFFAKVERCRLENTVVSFGTLCYGRAYLDFSPRRLVSCGSPLTKGVPLVASQLVMTWVVGSPLALISLWKVVVVHIVNRWWKALFILINDVRQSLFLWMDWAETIWW